MHTTIHIKHTFILVLIAGILLLTGCGKADNTDNSVIAQQTTNAVTAEETTPMPQPTPVADVTELSDEDILLLRSENIMLEEETAAELINLISDMEVYYLHSELFEIDEALQKYAGMELISPVSNEIIINNKINPGDLYNRVLANNEEHIRNNPAVNLQTIDNNTLRNITDIITDIINEKLSGNIDIDTNILDYTLKTLRIFERGGFSTAMVYHSESIMTVNFNVINATQIAKPDINVLETVIRHEAMHLIQMDFVNSNQYDYNTGMSYSYKDLIVNPLYMGWYTEASAEKLKIRANEEPYVYFRQINDLEAIALAAIMNVSNTVTSFEELTLQRDLNKLYEYFTVTEEQDKREILNMMFAFEIMNSTRHEGFAANYEMQNNSKFYISDFDEYSLQLAPAICISLTKIFYKNLIEFLINDAMTLDEIYYLISIFETEMNRITRYHSISRTIQNQVFADSYTEIQNNFWELLSHNSSLQAPEIKELFIHYNNTYFSKPGESIFVTIQSLSSEKNEFLAFMTADRDKSKTYSINR